MSSEYVEPYSAIPYYQFHFVVSTNGRNPGDRVVARTRKKTKGVIHKQVTDVWWEGGPIAKELNGDSQLRSLLTTVLLEENDIYIDPAESGVRIYGDWKPEHKVKISKEAVEAFDIIAGHVKRYIAA
ncbi:MAG: hypothetical protein ACE5JV_02970 [Nitrososphaerales archaeon]